MGSIWDRKVRVHQRSRNRPAQVAEMARTAGHQPTHRMPDQHDPGHRGRPVPDHEFEQAGEQAAVGGDVQSSVVPKVDRSQPEIRR